MTDQKTIVLGVTGGIAAYKSCELVRLLTCHGFDVKVTMTEAATRFVSPLTFRTLTNNPVAASLWADEPGSPVHHVSLAAEADVMVIAPCTANVIAKLACGRADDMLTTTALATEAPLVIAPSMNMHMWRAEATRANVAVLRERGAVIVEPAVGALACGEIGEGRLAALGDIVEAVEVEAERAGSLSGVRVLVTAGGTREPIDPVRYIGNRGSGKTGFAVAEEAARRGADVVLVTGPTWLPDPFRVEVVRVETAAEMRDAVAARASDAGVIVATAAVADFRPVKPASDKIKKGGAPAAIELTRTPDILAELGKAKRTGQVLVGFAAETRDVLEGARSKLAGKSLDMVVANDVSEPGLGFGADENRVTFVTEKSTETLPVLSKRAIAARLLDRVADLLGGQAK